MGLFSRKIKESEIAMLQNAAPVITINNVHHGLQYLVELVKQIRPAHLNNYAESDVKFKALLYKLQNDIRVLFSLRKIPPNY